jgi:hypothetical protein
MAQSAELRYRSGAPHVLDCTSKGRVLSQAEMGHVTVVVFGVPAQEPSQMSMAQHNDMVEQIPSDRTDHAFNISILPWGPGCDGPISNSHPL